MLGRPAAFDHIKPLNGWPMHHTGGQLTPPIYLDDRPYLTPLGYEIARPASTNSLPSAPLPGYLAHRLPGPGQPFQLPALSTLASLAAASGPAGPRYVVLLFRSEVLQR